MPLPLWSVGHFAACVRRGRCGALRDGIARAGCSAATVAAREQEGGRAERAGIGRRGGTGRAAAVE